MQAPHGSHDVHGSEYGKARRPVGIIDFEMILREDKRHGMLSMDVVACCRSRVTWVRDGYLPVKPSVNNSADLYLRLRTQHKGPTRVCLQLVPWDRWVWSPYYRSSPYLRLPVQCAPSPHRTGFLAADVVLPTSVCSIGHIWWRRGDVMMILMSVLEGFLIGQGSFLRYHMSATGPPKQNN